MVLLLVVLSLLVLSTIPEASAKKITACFSNSPCSCKTDTGKLIDLSNLGRLTAKSKAKGWDFIWEPCKEFNVKGLKQKVSAVQHVSKPESYFEIGSTTNVVYEVRDGVIVMGLVASDYFRGSAVNFTCDYDTTEWKFIEEKPMNTYQFVLRSPNCCTSPRSSSISVGSVLVIVFFVTLVLYIVIGVTVQKRFRRAEGREVVPNRSFWSALPGLIRDGFKFVFTCGSRKTTYSKI